MNAWPGCMPPREKLLKFGAASLTDTELLAIFLRTGVAGIHVMEMAGNLIAEFGSLHNLMSADYPTLCAQKGLGESKYTQIQAISELASRCSFSHLAKEGALCNPKITREFIYNILSHREREVFLVLFLDNQYRVISHDELFIGSISSVEIHPREIVREALKVNAAALILAHNHPSGQAEPSEADNLITVRIIKACALLDIRVLDHLVIGHGEYVSFAERGWI